MSAAPVLAVLSLAGLAHADPVVSLFSDAPTTYGGATSTLQRIKPLVQQRGSDLEGGDNAVDTDWTNDYHHDQVTEYAYNVVKSGGGTTPPDSKVASKRMLKQTKYPRQTSGKAETDRSEYFSYDAPGTGSGPA